jgi:broad specificity phosphatase PhoE
VTSLLLVRHAQSEWNAAGRWQGWADPPLTALGRAQAEEAGERLRRTAPPIDRAVSSDLDRARTTASIVAGIAGTPELVGRSPLVEEVSGLREFDVGQWSGLTRAEITAEWPKTLAAWDAGALDATPGGEPRADFDARVQAAVIQIIAAHPGQRVLVVAHGGVVHSIGKWLGLPLAHVLHIAGFWLEHEAGRTSITGTVDLLRDEPTGGHPAGDAPSTEEPADDRIPDDSAGAR